MRSTKPERVFVKLGGALITDKQQRYRARHSLLKRLAEEIAAARAIRPELALVVAHGSGSFGHVAAQETGYDHVYGHRDATAYAHVAAAAAELHQIVRRTLLEAGLPVVSLPPSASLLIEEETPIQFAWHPFERLLAWGGIPLTYGDVALTPTGSTIVSTEMVLTILAERLHPDRLILLTDVPGVFLHPPREDEPTPPIIAEITPQNWQAVRHGVRGAQGTDVTGGMARKVEQMLTLIERLPNLEVLIASGHEPGLLKQALRGYPVHGTLIRSDEPH